jgi:hypothetical protein
VEYTLSRSISPVLIAEYQTRLPNKTLLENKLCELRKMAEGLADDEDDGSDGECRKRFLTFVTSQMEGSL